MGTNPQIIYLSRSTRADKKYMVVFDDGHVVHFGAAGWSDFTQHRDTDRRARYIARHRAAEDWTRRGLKTAGFWSRWILWGPSPSIAQCIAYVNARFGVRVIRK